MATSDVLIILAAQSLLIFLVGGLVGHAILWAFNKIKEKLT